MAEQPKSNPTLVEVFTEMFRAVARPAVTVIFAAVIAQAVLQGINLPQWFLAVAIPCITWWFAERTVTHIKTKTPMQSGTKTSNEDPDRVGTESGTKKGGTDAQT